MKMKIRSVLTLSFVTLLSACGVNSGTSTGGSNAPDAPVTPAPKGKRIFLTSETHTGKFAATPGGNGMPAADAFCASSTANPDTTKTFKAMLVDGVNRVPPGDGTAVDWVLQPNTDYYRVDGKTLVGTTTSNGIFDIDYSGTKDLTNSISSTASAVWTGLSVLNFDTNLNTCLGWSSNSSTDYALFGNPSAVDGFFLQKSMIACDTLNPIYCVEQ